MAIKGVTFKIKGMLRDLSESAFSSEFAYENMNVRVTARDKNTLLSVSNERGNRLLSITDGSTNVTIQGTVIGYSIVKDFLILFTTTNSIDRIYKLQLNGENLSGNIFYQGNLNFDTEHPIETLPSYENENVIKVYWTDGKNLPRVINISDNVDISTLSDLSFDFVLTINLIDTVKIEKSHTNGLFPAGVVQYAFTYYNRYGLETNVFNTTSLNYVSFYDRGANAEEVVSNSFKITVDNLDTRFDYIRIYSILRTSISAVPTVKILIDLPITGSSITYIDTNTVGSIVDSTVLLYVGGEDIVALTMTLKDNTLFLGNLKLSKPLAGDIEVDGLKLKDILKNNSTDPDGDVYLDFTLDEVNNSAIPTLNRPASTKSRPVTNIDANENILTLNNYPYDSGYLLSNLSSKIKRFKAREWYRLGVKFQHKTGRFSEVIWLGDFYNNNVSLSYATYILTHFPRLIINNTNITNALIANDYVRAQGVIVYPSLNDREVIALGILCPTIVHAQAYEDNAPAYQSSWFSRPLSPVVDSTPATTIASLHNLRIYSLTSTYGEVQGVTNRVTETLFNLYYFKVNHKVVTFHSPEIEVSTDLVGFDFRNTKLRIVGNVVLTAAKSGMQVTLTNAAKAGDPRTANYFEWIKFNNTPHPIGQYGSGSFDRVLAINPFWMDERRNTSVITESGFTKFGGFPVYPWLAYRVMNDSNDESKPGLLGLKKMFNLRFCGANHYLNTVWDFFATGQTYRQGIETPILFNSTEATFVKLPIVIDRGSSGGYSASYSGNIDKVITWSKPSDDTFDDVKGYPITYTREIDDPSNYSLNIITDSTGDTGDWTATDPISMKYKSSPHLVIALKSLLPSINNVYNAGADINGNPTGVPNINLSNFPPLKDSIIDFNTTVNSASFWLSELYKETDVNTRFGGLTELALLNNLWYNSGDLVELSSTPLQLDMTEGDCFLQRFDSLRTYPFTLEDLNSIIDIVSFMCESRINLDGRYDKNRNSINYFVSTPTNYNLFNPIYNQLNNYFNYRVANYFNDSDDFPNLVTWTTTKTEGADTDVWTNITLASTLLLDGDKGEIRSLNNFNDNIIAFQDLAITNVLFNSRVLINTSDGVPIEIANSAKVEGKRKIADLVGTTNKWSIIETPSGLYFMDTLNKTMYLFNGSLDNLSDKLGFHAWSLNNITSTIWNPEYFNGFVGYYDSKLKDVYFTSKETTLCYSELLGLFTSFFSYENVPFMFNFKDKFISVKGTSLWALNEGLYNTFFGEFKPFYTTVVVNPEINYEKIFNNLEFRADRFNDDGLVINKTMDYIKVWNEYLEGEASLVSLKGSPSNLKEKFRVWRALIPRRNDNPLLRIRNPWLYLELGLRISNTDRTVLHDMTVYYTV